MSQPLFVILAEGKLGLETSKTAASVVRYLPGRVSAVIDSQLAGRTSQDVLGVGGGIPVVASLAEALGLAGRGPTGPSRGGGEPGRDDPGRTPPPASRGRGRGPGRVERPARAPGGRRRTGRTGAASRRAPRGPARPTCRPARRDRPCPRDARVSRIDRGHRLQRREDDGQPGDPARVAGAGCGRPLRGHRPERHRDRRDWEFPWTRWSRTSSPGQRRGSRSRPRKVRMSSWSKGRGLCSTPATRPSRSASCTARCRKR